MAEIVSEPKGPFRVVTVNAASAENSKMLVDLVQEHVKDKYLIEHVANCSNLEEVEKHVTELKPDVVFIASSFEPDHSQRMHETATTVHGSVKTCIIPYGMQAEQGPQGVVDYVVKELPQLFGDLTYTAD